MDLALGAVDYYNFKLSWFWHWQLAKVWKYLFPKHRKYTAIDVNTGVLSANVEKLSSETITSSKRKDNKGSLNKNLNFRNAANVLENWTSKKRKSFKNYLKWLDSSLELNYSFRHLCKTPKLLLYLSLLEIL